MRTAKARMRGGSYADASACCCAGDFGISVFYRARRCKRAAPSPLNRLPDSSVLSVERFADPSVFAADSAQSSAGIAFHLSVGDTVRLATSPGYPIGTRGAEVSGVHTLRPRGIRRRRERTLL